MGLAISKRQKKTQHTIIRMFPSGGITIPGLRYSGRALPPTMLLKILKKALVIAKEYVDANPNQAPLITINNNKWTSTT
jgi:hypothetical protein